MIRVCREFDTFGKVNLCDCRFWLFVCQQSSGYRLVLNLGSDEIFWVCTGFSCKDDNSHWLLVDVDRTVGFVFAEVCDLYGVPF